MSQKPSGNSTRIQIDNIEDWSRIQRNFTDAITSSLSQNHVTPEMQDAIKAHLLQWRDNTFQLAKLNIRVNGHNLEDYSEGQEDTEPFDEVLDRRIWSLNAERMIWDKELGDRRRKIPSEMERLVEDMLISQAPLFNEETPDTHMQQEDSLETNVAELYQGTLELLGNLDKTAPRILERTKRAQSIAEEIHNLSK